MRCEKERDEYELGIYRFNEQASAGIVGQT